MAIAYISTQGTIVRANAVIVDCPQIIGEITETRATTEYSCLTSDESIVALGSITRAPFTMQVLYNPDGTVALGQAELETSFDGPVDIPFEIELNDNPTGTTNTILQFNGGVSERKKGFPKDGALTMDYTVQVSSAITIVAATP